MTSEPAQLGWRGACPQLKIAELAAATDDFVSSWPQAEVTRADVPQRHHVCLQSSRPCVPGRLVPGRRSFPSIAIALAQDTGPPE